jgi:uncharacterized protein (TIGR02246 family)
MTWQGPIEDRLAIRELVESYNDAVMRGDAEAWADHWAEDGVWALPWTEEIRGRDAIVALWTQVMGNLQVDGFFASAAHVELDGDRGTGRWYQQEHLQVDGQHHQVIGEYDDEYVRQDGRWRFARRIYKVRSRLVLPAAT